MAIKDITKLHNQVIKKHLSEYSKWTFGRTMKAVASVQIGDQRYSIGFTELCEQALELIRHNERNALKFERLVVAMKKGRYEGLYLHLMKEHIDEAYK